LGAILDKSKALRQPLCRDIKGDLTCVMMLAHVANSR